MQTCEKKKHYFPKQLKTLFHITPKWKIDNVVLLQIYLIRHLISSKMIIKLGESWHGITLLLSYISTLHLFHLINSQICLDMLHWVFTAQCYCLAGLICTQLWSLLTLNPFEWLALQYWSLYTAEPLQTEVT